MAVMVLGSLRLKNWKTSLCAEKAAAPLFGAGGTQSEKQGKSRSRTAAWKGARSAQTKCGRLGRRPRRRPEGLSLKATGDVPQNKKCFSAGGDNLRRLTPQRHAGERGSHALSGTRAERRPEARGRPRRGARHYFHRRQVTVQNEAKDWQRQEIMRCSLRELNRQ